MARTRKTGEELADSILADMVRADGYDPAYLAAKATYILAAILDDNHRGSAKAFARNELEQLTDFDAVIAANPIAKKRGA